MKRGPSVQGGDDDALGRGPGCGVVWHVGAAIDTGCRRAGMVVLRQEMDEVIPAISKPDSVVLMFSTSRAPS